MKQYTFCDAIQPPLYIKHKNIGTYIDVSL